MTTTLYGASDDLIEIDGDISEEFSALGDDDENYIAFSNGMVFKISYDGTWVIKPQYAEGQGTRWSIVLADGEDEDNYSDRLTIHEDVKWAVHGKSWVMQR